MTSTTSSQLRDDTKLCKALRNEINRSGWRHLSASERCLNCLAKDSNDAAQTPQLCNFVTWLVFARQRPQPTLELFRPARTSQREDIVSTILWFFLLLLLPEITTQAANAQTARDLFDRIGRFESSIYQAERRGDYRSAAAAAQECAALLMASEELKHHGRYCVLHYARALATGRGVVRDVPKAFQILEDEVRTDKDSEFALELAELYLDGNGVPRDPVEAAVLVWRVVHGALSGLCNECDETWAHARAVNARLDRELSPEQRVRATKIEEDRFPDIAAKEREAETLFFTFVVTAGILIVGACAWCSHRGGEARSRGETRI